MATRIRWLARVAVWLLPVGAAFAFGVTAALAHPLGNFTVNHYSRVELNGDSVRVRYVLDLAEIPSVQERRAADTDGDGTVTPAEWDAYKERKIAEILPQLDLIIDNQKVDLRPDDVRIEQPMGQGDIQLVRLEGWFSALGSLTPNTQHLASFRDRSDPARIGWREVVVNAGSGAVLSDSSVPAQDVSNELQSYPDDMLQNPLDRREAHWSFVMDGSSSSAGAVSASGAVHRPTDPFAALVTAVDLNPTVILLALLGAAILGGAHAASPGHGKSVMAAYIVGTRGTIGHAVLLAMSVTLSHTTGVLVLGVLTVVASNVIFPEKLYPWLTLLSGAVVLVIGGRFLLSGLLRRKQGHDQHHLHHDHDHDHDHDHHHHHHDLAPTWRSLFALGLAGGMVPSASALVVLLSSLALGRLGFGLVLIVAFGLGMAAVLVTTGVLLVHAGRLMVRLFPDEGHSAFGRRVVAVMPLLSAGVMTLLGVVATFEGLLQVGALGS